jgi:hypothetical protein
VLSLKRLVKTRTLPANNRTHNQRQPQTRHPAPCSTAPSTHASPSASPQLKPPHTRLCRGPGGRRRTPPTIVPATGTRHFSF